MKIKFYLSLFITITFFSCSNKSDKSLFDDAIKLIDAKQYSEAALKFEELLDEFPQSNLAPQSLFEMAKMYQGFVIKNLNNEQSLLKSVSLYRKIYDEYPDSKQAENSLFMAGFLLANELSNLEEAEKTYKLFIEKYSNSELAKSASIELENLGKSPEEILENKINDISTY